MISTYTILIIIITSLISFISGAIGGFLVARWKYESVVVDMKLPIGVVIHEDDSDEYIGSL